jgi:hypothetical protein
MGRIFGYFMNWTGLAKLIFNATLNRDIGNDIELIGFSEVKLDRSEFGDRNQRLLLGVATK